MKATARWGCIGATSGGLTACPRYEREWGLPGCARRGHKQSALLKGFPRPGS